MSDQYSVYLCSTNSHRGVINSAIGWQEALSALSAAFPSLRCTPVFELDAIQLVIADAQVDADAAPVLADAK